MSFAHGRRDRGLWRLSRRHWQRGLSTLVTCQPPLGFETVRALIAAEARAGRMSGPRETLVEASDGVLGG